MEIEFWLSLLYEAEPSVDKVFISVGFNKGYHYAIWLSLWMSSLNLNPATWYTSLLNHTGAQSETSDGTVLCGFCEDCKLDIASAVRKNIVRNKYVAFFFFCRNYRFLNFVISDFANSFIFPFSFFFISFFLFLRLCLR